MRLMVLQVIPVRQILEHYGICTTASNDGDMMQESAPSLPDPKTTSLAARRKKNEDDTDTYA